MNQCIHVNLGTMDYLECLELQKKAQTLRQQGEIPDCLLIVEHPSVFTIGRSGSRQNLLVPDRLLDEKGICCVDIDRGGDITYHGPGQLVVYPIFMIREKSYGVADFITDLESIMIRILKDSGIQAETNPRNRGVWVGERKVGFVGIAVRRGVTSHGLALNVSPDLGFFSMINPCGMHQVRVTSMEQLAGDGVSFTEITSKISAVIQEQFRYRAVEMGLEPFRRFLTGGNDH